MKIHQLLTILAVTLVSTVVGAKEWDPYTPICGQVEEKEIVLPIHYDGDPLTDTLSLVCMGDADRWIDWEAVPQQGYEQDVIPPDKVTWSCSGGTVTSPDYTTTWTPPGNGGTYLIYTEMDDLPLPIGVNDTGSRDDGAIGLYPPRPVVALEVVMQGIGIGDAVQGTKRHLSWAGDQDWNSGPVNYPRETTPNGEFKVRGYAKKLEIRARAVPNAGSYPYESTQTVWVDWEVRGVYKIDGVPKPGPSGVIMDGTQDWQRDGHTSKWVYPTRDLIAAVDGPGVETDEYNNMPPQVQQHYLRDVEYRGFIAKFKGKIVSKSPLTWTQVLELQDDGTRHWEVIRNE